MVHQKPPKHKLSYELQARLQVALCPMPRIELLEDLAYEARRADTTTRAAIIDTLQRADVSRHDRACLVAIATTPPPAPPVPPAPDGCPPPARSQVMPDLAPESVLKGFIPTLKLLVPIDPETARLALALGHSRIFRVWLVMQEIVRAHGLATGSTGKNSVTYDELSAALSAHGIEYTTRGLNDILNHGDDLFWRARVGDRIYFRGQDKLACKLMHAALADGKAYLFEHDKPGARAVYVDISGTIGDYNARVFAAWLASNTTKNKYPVISKTRLERLFNRTRKHIIRWENRADVTTAANWAQQDRATDQTPQYAVTTDIARRDGTIAHGWLWQRANTYYAPALDKHHARGQGKKIRKNANSLLRTSLVVDESTRKARNFESVKAWVNAKTVNPWELNYVYLGNRRTATGKVIGVWELTNPSDKLPRTAAAYPSQTGARVVAVDVFGE